MRKTPMPARTKPMKRTALKRPAVPSLARTTRLKAASPRKIHWQRRAKARRLAYMQTHLRCFLCGISIFAKPSRPLECHHLFGRGSEAHECEDNYGAICDRDHRHYHSGGECGEDGARLPELTPGMLLWAKEMADGPVNRERLAALKGWKGLPAEWEPRELPAEFIRERERHAA